MAKGEIVEDLGVDAVISGGPMIGDGSNDIADVIWVASEGRGLVGVCFVLYLPGEVVDYVCLLFVAVVEFGEKSAECVAPLFSIFVSFNFCGQLRGCRCFHGLREVPVLCPGLFQEFYVFSVSALLFLVFLEAYLVGEMKVRVVVCVVYGVSQLRCFNLCFGTACLVCFGFVKKCRSQVAEGVKTHFSEISGPLSGLRGFPMGREVFIPVNGRGEGVIPEDFPEVSLWRVGKCSKANWFMVASDTGMNVGTGPELRLEVGRGKKEINGSWVLLL